MPLDWLEGQNLSVFYLLCKHVEVPLSANGKQIFHL